MIEETRETLLRQCRKRLGKPDPAIAARIEATTDMDRLEWLLDRLIDVSSWEELFSDC